MAVTCEQIREALSARLDGESAALSREVVDAHLSGCVPCRTWQQAVVGLTARLSPRETPDLSGRILASVRAEEARVGAKQRRARATRVALAMLAVAQLVLSGPVLLLGHDHTAPVHVAHEVGSFDAALALGLLLAALRPRLAAGMLPLVAAITALLLLTAGSDLAVGRTAVLDEAPHLLDLLGVLLLLRLAVTSGWTGLRVPGSIPPRPAGRN